MRFQIEHSTEYRYPGGASEAYLEARLIPPALPWQEVIGQRIKTSPQASVSDYTDFFGNAVRFISLGSRHHRLRVLSELQVRTLEREVPRLALECPVAEARQIVSSAGPRVFDYLHSSAAVPYSPEARSWARRLLPPAEPLGSALASLASEIHAAFRYDPLATENETPLGDVWRQKAGVCQDFAHIMLAVLRAAGLPCRYVCGYIESAALVGSLATHAWVEVLVPGMHWVAYDPTNNCRCGRQHVTVSVGRDFHDATPLRGTFKGSNSQRLEVHVSMRRLPEVL